MRRNAHTPVRGTVSEITPGAVSTTVILTTGDVIVGVR
jgi:molybdopterin-binding protein